MLNRIRGESRRSRFVPSPTRPVLNLLGHRPITEVDIFAHQVVEVTHFIIDLIVPSSPV